MEAVTYGWQMDRESETEALYQLLMAGESAERSPVYLEGAVTRGENDIGDTYVEIDYTNQRMWYNKDGSLLVETAVGDRQYQRRHGALRRGSSVL